MRVPKLTWIALGTLGLIVAFIYLPPLLVGDGGWPHTSPQMLEERRQFEEWLAKSPGYEEVRRKAIHMGNGLSPTIEFNDVLKPGEKGYSMYIFCGTCSNRSERIIYFIRVGTGGNVIEYRRGPTWTR